MPRGAREKGKSGIYHIILRGHNRQTIFEDDEDREKLLKTLGDCKEKSGFKIYCYCLMGNHIHLLLHEVNEELGVIMRRIGASYVYWYNKKYRRCGHLFQDRYKSEAVDTDSYFLTVLRYIHRNPVKAGLVKKMSDYHWSSYNGYIDNNGITALWFLTKPRGAFFVFPRKELNQNAFKGFIAHNLLELKAKAGAKSTKRMAYLGDCF